MSIVSYLRQLDYFDNFFAEHGQTALLFFYQSTPEESVAGDKSMFLCKKDADIQSQSVCLADEKQEGKRLWITDGTQDPFPGCCLFFIRLNPQKQITNLNIHQVSLFMSL